MTQPRILTFEDCITRMEDFARHHAEKSISSAHLRRLIIDAYDEIAHEHSWGFLKETTRVKLVAPQTTGTVVFDLTGGTYERQLTLTGATWPSNVIDYAVRFDDLLCYVDTRESDTVVTLAEDMCPEADVASTTYSCFPRWYLLPADFESIWEPMHESSDWGFGDHIDISEMAALLRNDSSTGDIRYYSIAAAEGTYGSLALHIFPPSSSAETLDFVYRRRPRELKHSGKATADSAGTITCSLGSTSVTGSSTTFADSMEGAVIRSSSTTAKPTDRAGENPYSGERTILSVSSTTACTVDAAFPVALSGRGYVVSDPIDLHVSVHEAFIRCCEKHVAQGLRMYPQERKAVYAAYEESLAKAKGMDGGRVRQRRIAGSPGARKTRLADSRTSRDSVSI